MIETILLTKKMQLGGWYDYGMWYSATLVLHIGTALLTGVVLLYALFVLKTKKRTQYELCMLMLGFVASLEVVTGTLLAQLSLTISAMSLSLHMTEYLGVCLLVEVFLFVRIKKFVTPAFSA